MDPPTGYAKPAKNQEWVDNVWGLDDTVRTIVLAHQAFPDAKFVLYSRYGMDQLQGALSKDAAGLAVSRFVVVKVGTTCQLILTVWAQYCPIAALSVTSFRKCSGHPVYRPVWGWLTSIIASDT